MPVWSDIDAWVKVIGAFFAGLAVLSVPYWKYRQEREAFEAKRAPDKVAIPAAYAGIIAGESDTVRYLEYGRRQTEALERQAEDMRGIRDLMRERANAEERREHDAQIRADEREKWERQQRDGR